MYFNATWICLPYVRANVINTRSATWLTKPMGNKRKRKVEIDLKMIGKVATKKDGISCFLWVSTF